MMTFATLDEEFVDKIIGGFPAVMGKVTMGSTPFTMAYVDHDGQIYKLMNGDSLENFGKSESRDIEARIFSSFSFS
jgi:hypothetical protein